MYQLDRPTGQLSIAKNLLTWTLLLIPLSLTVGSIVALFLWLLDWATHTRWANEWLVYLLPVAGVAIYWLYKLWGKNSEQGNNLIMDEIHQPGGGVPLRMTPLVLFTTIITHLFGGSAGREGTAVQMGGSIAGLFGKWYKLSPERLRILLMAGIAAGFGAVFGTPVAGAVFALEVLTIGAIRYEALLPCFIASFLAHLTTSAWGIHHTQYHIHSLLRPDTFLLLPINIKVLLEAIMAGAAFGLVAYLFSELTHTIKNTAKKIIPIEWLIPVAGAALIIALTFMLGTTDYLGIGVTGKDVNSVSIVSAFQTGNCTYWSWFWKLLFTAITLGTGFKGGEVTPLFFIGATLGNTIAFLCGAPVDLFAAMGFIAVFAGATNTPLACTIMGVELFGGEYTLYFAVACFTAYYFSGHTGIYHSQRIAVNKHGASGNEGTTLKEIRNARITRNIELFRKWLGRK